MKISYLLAVLLCLCCFQCDSTSDDNDPDANCATLQEDIDYATLQKVAALEAYTSNPSDAGVCEEYVEALENRIEKIQAFLDAGCADNNAAIKLNLEAAINEDQETIEGLNC